MKVEEKKIKIRDIAKGYKDSGNSGVVGYNGDLDIRPSYQREFVYKEDKRNAVIDTITKGFPLSIIYWAKTITGYEVLDGQQRIISICQYVAGDFSINYKYFDTLSKKEQDKILDYELIIYICDGIESELLAWFERINISGEPLTKQELRNATYTGSWLSDAKEWFSKANSQAKNIGSKYLKGSAIRQDYLETVLRWISGGSNEDINDYMHKHRKDADAKDLWNYFQKVITWINTVFPSYRKEMRGLSWGPLFDKFSSNYIDAKETEDKIKILMSDEEILKKSGIYQYILTKDTKYLSLRAFTLGQKRTAFENCSGECNVCDDTFTIDEMEADHIDPWSKGGKTDMDNLQMLCKKCNRRKSNH